MVITLVCAGMMWMRQFSDVDVNLRHTCEQGDRLQGYGWLMHDGITFGVQEIRDNDFTLTTEFVKRMGGDHGGDWTWRITAKQHVSADSFFSVVKMYHLLKTTEISLIACYVLFLFLPTRALHLKLQSSP